MADFNKEQKDYIELTISVAIETQAAQLVSLMTEGKDIQDKIAKIVADHNAELHQSADFDARLCVATTVFDCYSCRNALPRY